MIWQIRKKYTATLKIETTESDDEGNTWSSSEEWPLATDVDAVVMLDLFEVIGHGLAQIADRLSNRGLVIRDHINEELEKLVDLFE